MRLSKAGHSGLEGRQSSAPGPAEVAASMPALIPWGLSGVQRDARSGAIGTRASALGTPLWAVVSGPPLLFVHLVSHQD